MEGAAQMEWNRWCGLHCRSVTYGRPARHVSRYQFAILLACSAMAISVSSDVIRPAYMACTIRSPSQQVLKRESILRSSCLDVMACLNGSRRKMQSRSYSTGSLRANSPMRRSSSAFFRLRFPESNVPKAVSSLPRDNSGVELGNNDDAKHLDGRTEFIAECKLPTEMGMFRLRSYRYKGAKLVIRNGERVLEWTEMEPVVVCHGDLKGKTGVTVRVHDQCFTSEVLGSKRCDCKEQLDMALMHISENDGAVIYMPQEGRGIGLANKIAAYELQDGGLDTVDANRHLGFDDDERSYACVPFILQDIGIESVQLITNNPYKVEHLRDSGIKIENIKPSIVIPNVFNENYLRTKAIRMAHLLSLDRLRAPTSIPASVPDSEEGCFGKESVADAIASIRDGKMVLLVGREGAASGAALVMSAAKATPQALAKMSRVSGGLITGVLRPERWEELLIGTAGDQVPVTVDLNDDAAYPAGMASLSGRAATLQALADASRSATAFRQPGHIFVRKGGGRGPHAALHDVAEEITSLAAGDDKQSSMAVFCKLFSADGVTGLALSEVVGLAHTLGLVVTSEADLDLYRKAEGGGDTNAQVSKES